MTPTTTRKYAFSFLAFVLSFTLVLYVIATIHDTFFDDGSTRVTFGEGKARGWLDHHGKLIIVYTRGYTVYVGADVILSRLVTCTPKDKLVKQFSVAPIYKRDEAGVYPPIERYIDTPMPVPVGTPCTLTSYLMWQPKLSAAPILSKVGDIDFIVQASP